MAGRRTIIQIVFAALSNSYYKGFLEGGIYKGASKSACVPGLNCYSCPGALGSCPIGAMQAVLSDRDYNFSLYAAGFIMLFGAALGRVVCGFLCPFGLVQDALDKIPFNHKIRRVAGEKYLKSLKYLILAVFVIILPAFIKNDFGSGDPWFCKYICPSGTFMAGWPLVMLNDGIRDAAGLLYAWKSFILIVLLLLSIVIYRPFCRYLCPLGAIYGLCNKISFYSYEIDQEKCTACGTCRQVCKFNLEVYKNPNSVECIRCGECIRGCPTTAIKRRKLAPARVERKSSDVAEN